MTITGTRGRAALSAVVLGLMAAACTPTVKMEAPKEPITVNLNVKIQHEIYVKVDKDVEALFEDEGLF
ncbi:YnbE family lipoprotein [Marinobacter halodurans]|uniref:YnbE family lipoprotein n=1 Tax=Marinobacter halodurans TaxID=2528979 RepID=A0ABY1ZSM2_9GAMM|nr:YnbE family lipoprotein [Marinobacter halodurans]TBW58448.1 YnbE family lipoprotein [Marinobacter halodurans]